MEVQVEGKVDDLKIKAGTMYDLNKQLVDQEKKMSPTAIRELTKKVAVWFARHKGKYFMLLNNDLHDYTVFNFKGNIDVASNECIGCLTDRGDLVSGEIQPDGNWEFWIHINDGSIVYYLFDYTDAVIEC